MGSGYKHYIMYGLKLSDQEVENLREDIHWEYRKNHFKLINTSPMSSDGKEIFGVVYQEKEEWEGLELFELDVNSLLAWVYTDEAEELIKEFEQLTGSKRRLKDIGLFIFSRWS